MTAIADRIQESADLLAGMARDDRLASCLAAVVDACVAALAGGGKLLFMGNGGSAADAQHLAGELVSRFAYDRPGLPAFALTTDTSVMTAIGNDYGYERLFARQVQAVGRRGDVVFGLSTSGRSPNVLAGLQTARELGLITVGMTGNQKARIVELVDHAIEIPSHLTPRIQEGHIVVGHLICGMIEERVFPRQP
ncbi:MAG: D-sedoheptulose 7-phosphate isomerase [Lautropia sp.]